MSNNHNPTKGPPEPDNTAAESVSNTSQPVVQGGAPTPSSPISEVNNLVENFVTATADPVNTEKRMKRL